MLVEDLFPKLDSITVDFLRRDYVESVLVDLAQRKKLTLTSLYNHPTSISDICGQVILGHGYRDNKSIQGEIVPNELQEYKVYCKSTNGSVISYKCGHKPTGSRMVGRYTKTRQIIYEPVVVYPLGETATEGWLNLKDAWMLLRYTGKNCTAARTSKEKKERWLFEECSPPKKKTVSKKKPVIKEEVENGSRL